jgi:hypothetical protein
MKPGFELENLVCEVDRVPGQGACRWYELDLDARPDRIDLAGGAVAARVIAATRRMNVRELEQAVRRLESSVVTHVQFETPDDALTARRMSHLVVAAGRRPLPARHLDRPPANRQVLVSYAERLAGLDGEIVKLVYPAVDAEHVEMGLEMLATWVGPALSLTPAGTRQSRVAAALAGSRLVYAPMRHTGDRMSARWWWELATGETPPAELYRGERP